MKHNWKKETGMTLKDAIARSKKILGRIPKPGHEVTIYRDTENWVWKYLGYNHTPIETSVNVEYILSNYGRSLELRVSPDMTGCIPLGAKLILKGSL